MSYLFLLTIQNSPRKDDQRIINLNIRKKRMFLFTKTKYISVDLALNIFLAGNSGGMGGCFK